MKARVEPRTCNQKARNTGCCRLLSLRPVLENVKGVKRKGSLCAGGLQCRFSEATTANVSRRALIWLWVAANPLPQHSPKQQHRNNQQTTQLPHTYIYICIYSSLSSCIDKNLQPSRDSTFGSSTAYVRLQLSLIVVRCLQCGMLQD